MKDVVIMKLCWCNITDWIKCRVVYLLGLKREQLRWNYNEDNETWDFFTVIIYIWNSGLLIKSTHINTARKTHNFANAINPYVLKLQSNPSNPITDITQQYRQPCHKRQTEELKTRFIGANDLALTTTSAQGSRWGARA